MSIGARLATITGSDGGIRFDTGKRSWHVFKEDPIFGVGLGNWKIRTFKEENSNLQDFTVFYKAHSDFIEITTVTGIFGGLFFLSIFLLTEWFLLNTLVRNVSFEEIALLFLPALGLYCHSFDAFFNFPQDRPEIQALFDLYI